VSFLQVGDAEGKDLGEKLFDSLFRDRDIIDLVPRLIKAWVPGRFDLRSDCRYYPSPDLSLGFDAASC
jgi:hypothetical protein